MVLRIRRAAVLWGSLALAAGVSFSGCAATGSLTRDAQARDQVEELRQKIVELQRKAAVAEVELARLHEKVALLEIAAQRTTGAPVSEDSPPSYDRTPIASSTRRGPVEESDLEAPPSYPPREESPAPYSEPAASPGSAPSPSGDSSAAETIAVSAVAQQLYDEAYSLYNQGQYVEAEARFQLFLQRYPRTDLSDNALYWIGEARYGRRELRGAYAAFREAVTRFPDGNKVPDALLKSAQCAEQMGDRAAAREALQEILRRFPQSATAILAREMLDKLGG